MGRRRGARVPQRSRRRAAADTDRHGGDRLSHDRGLRVCGLPGSSGLAASARGRRQPDHARFPLHLVANQPATRLHSQFDFGATSLASKVQGREPVRIHPDDAAARGIADGDVVRLFNHRGACLAGAVLSRGGAAGRGAAGDRRLV